MPDMLLPQIPPAPAPAKPAAAAARSADVKPETESDQGFSDVLRAQMQPEKETTQTDAESHDEDVDVSGNAPPAAAAEGNPLPQGGKVVTAPITAIEPLLEMAETALQAGEAVVELPVEVETVVAIPGLPGEPLPAQPAPTQPASSAAGRQKPAIEALQLRGGPWKTGAAELPDTAQSAVAQAVRSAVAEPDENSLPHLVLERFGAEVRAATPARARGLETVLTANAAQPAATANANAGPVPQGLQSPVQQDAAVTRPALPTTSVETPLRQPGWDQALSERVLWVANQKFQGAEIKLSPAHLGPIEVRVQLHNDQAQISFTAQHAPAREALEAALPRLREMFTANGYSQVDVNVSQHSFAEQQRHAQGFEARFRDDSAGHEDDVEPASRLTAASGRLTGLPTSAIDLFA